MAALPGGVDVAITHKFISGKADGPDPTLVQPSKWNQDENLGAGADGQKIVRDSGQTDGGSWVNYESCSLTNQTGAAAAVGDVVAFSSGADSAVALDDTVSSLKKFCVALQTPANAAVGAYAISGPVPNVKATGAIARGQYVRKSATTLTLEDTGVALSSTVAPPVGAIGVALNAAAAGVVTVYLFPQTVTSSGSVSKGQCQLTKSGANLLLSGYNGNLITINSVDVVIPDSGPTLAIGAAVASTLYYIYAFVTGGVLTLEFSATVYAVQAGTGIKIKTGDATRTLVGLARTTAAPTWADSETQRFVLSYFNRASRGGRNYFTADRTTASNSFVELNTEIRVEFLTWADEAVGVSAAGTALAGSTQANSTVSGLGVDGTTVIDGTRVDRYNPNSGQTFDDVFGMSTAVSLAEGYHYLTLLGLTDTSTGTWRGGATGAKRCAVGLLIRG